MDRDRWHSRVDRLLAGPLAYVTAAVLLVVGTLGGNEKWYQQFGDIGSLLVEREQVVRRQRDRLDALFEHTTDCVARVELDDGVARIRAANANFETVFGPLDDTNGTQLPAATASTAAATRFRRHISSFEPVTVDMELQTTGRERTFRAQFVPTGGGEGVPKEGYVIYSEEPATEAQELTSSAALDLLERSQELAHVGAWELSLSDGTPSDLTWTDEVYRIHGLPVGTAVTFADAVSYFHPEDRDRVRRTLDRAIDSGTRFDIEARLVTDGGDQRWVRTLAEPTTDDGETVALRGMVQDITTRKTHERNLQSLHEATRALLHAASAEAICQLVVDIAGDLCNVDGIAVNLLADDGREFTPVAVSAGFAELCSARPAIRIGDTDSPAWRAFVDGETVAVDERAALPWADDGGGPDAPIFTSTRVDPTDDTTDLDDDVRSGLFVPVGDNAVVSVLSTDETVGSESRQLIETLVATTEAAFDRLESEASLRDREAELRTQNERLNRQMHLTDIIRSVNQSLVDVDSRDEVEAAVCSQLVESDRIAFAWIGTYDEPEDTVVPRTAAGDGADYLETVSLGTRGREPAWLTATTGSVTAVDNVVSGLRTEEGTWRRPALEAAFQSAVSVPIEHDGYTYGTLTVYAAEAGSLTDLEASVFDELGTTIGTAINAVQTKQALYGDAVTELTLRLTDAPSVLASLSKAVDCRVSFDGVSTHSSDHTQLFFTVSGNRTDEVTDLLDQHPLVASHRLIERTDDGGYFTATVTGGLVDSILVPQAASPKSMHAAGGIVELTVDVSPETDVRGFVDSFRAECGDVELLSRTTTDRSVTTETECVDAMFASLTDRQRETLTTAYYSGYFAWPRESTGEEIAEMLGVSQPTVNRHLRFGQLRLLERLFEGPGS